MSQPESQIFVLTIKSVEGSKTSFEVCAEDRAEASVVEFDPNQIMPGGDKAIELIKKIGGRKELGIPTCAEHENTCSRIGELLFRTFLQTPPAVYREYCEYKAQSEAHNKPRRIALQIPRELYYLPWEVLRDPTDPLREFLAIQGSVIRCDLASNASYVDWPDVSTYAVFIANTKGSDLDPYYKMSKRSIVRFKKIAPASYANFEKKLGKVLPFGLVFFGHGEVRSGEGYLYFVGRDRESDPRTARVISQEISKLSAMRIAYIMACESAWADQQALFEYSIAGGMLLTTRLAFVIGAQTKIDFYAAREFFERTMDNLAEGLPLDLAVGAARGCVHEISDADKAQAFSRKDWWVPVVYAKTLDFDLLRKSTASEQTRQPDIEATNQPRGIVAGVAQRLQGFFSATDNDEVRKLSDDIGGMNSSNSGNGVSQDHRSLHE